VDLQQSKFASRRRRIAMMTLAAALAAPVTVIAAPAPAAPVSLDIAGGQLSSALVQFARQSGLQLMFDASLVAGRRSAGLKARLPPEEALRRLLDGTGIQFVRAGPKVFVLRPAPTATAALRPHAPGDLQAGDPASSDPQAPQPTAPPAPSQVSELLVTGTLIHGVTQGPSPLVQIDRADIDRSGYATVAEALEALPQNFSGTATPITALTASDTTGTNPYYSSGVNLRGLGADATLVLINGRRLAGTGSNGDFADLSTVPTAVVDHIDVLLDGASALYGSDAVGGVVNVILKHDFDGAETRVRVGGAAGGATEYQAAQTVGYAWDGGNLIASYEFYRQEALPYSARSFTASADLRPFGGTDQRDFFSAPGNILEFDPAIGNFAVGWAIPKGNGLGLQPGDFLAGQTNLGEPNQGADLLPETTKHNVYVAAQQRLTSRITLSADFRFSDRTFAYAGIPPVTTLQVNNNNPYFASPNGATSELIATSLYNELGSQQGYGSAQNLGASLGAELELGGDWRGEVYGAYSQELGATDASHVLDNAFLEEALGAAPDDPRTAFSTAKDGYFNPYGPGGNSQSILNFIDSGHQRENFRTEVASVNAEADGTVFTLPGGPVKLASGVSYREETYRQALDTLQSFDKPTDEVSGPFGRNIVAAFAEVRAPLIGEANSLPGIKRLEISAAARVERYSDFGTTANPKVGVLWTPIDDLKMRATYGRSFRAPALAEEFAATQIGATFLPGAGGSEVLSLYTTGGNRNLKPEQATTVTAGFDYSPHQIPGLRLSTTWFDTRFTNRIEQPVIANLGSVLTDPAFSAYVTHVDPTNAADLARVEALISDPRYIDPGAFPAGSFGAIVDAGFVNASSLEVSGEDITAHYGFTAGLDQYALDISASHLDQYIQQVTAQAAPASFLDLPGNPTNLRGRGSLSWTRGAFSAVGTFNYVGSYHAFTGARIDSWKTFDLALTWRSPASEGPFKGLTALASARNLFNQSPPFYNGPLPLGIGYDPANADPVGRFVSLQLTKRW
jgi:iron complex outermembrane recepter protein